MVVGCAFHPQVNISPRCMILMENSEDMFRKALDASGITAEITCAEATALCRIYQFDMIAFREFCDGNGIKFKKCQFGCFE